MWTWFKNPENRAPIASLCVAISAIVSGIWGAYVFWISDNDIQHYRDLVKDDRYFVARQYLDELLDKDRNIAAAVRDGKLDDSAQKSFENVLHVLNSTAGCALSNACNDKEVWSEFGDDMKLYFNFAIPFIDNRMQKNNIIIYDSLRKYLKEKGELIEK